MHRPEAVRVVTLAREGLKCTGQKDACFRCADYLATAFRERGTRDILHRASQLLLHVRPDTDVIMILFSIPQANKMADRRSLAEKAILCTLSPTGMECTVLPVITSRIATPPLSAKTIWFNAYCTTA